VTPEAWAVNLSAIVAAGVAAYGSLGAKRAANAGKTSSDHAAEAGQYAAGEAQLAAERSEATSNGFADRTIKALERIERNGERTQAMLSDHIADHARADVRRIR
jgi:hypothetical protein